MSVTEYLEEREDDVIYLQIIANVGKIHDRFNTEL